MSEEQANPEEEFEHYRWEEDEGWQVLVSRLEFPARWDGAKKNKFILKRKQKYFRENVNPNYTIPSRTPSNEPAKDASFNYTSSANPHTATAEDEKPDKAPTPPLSSEETKEEAKAEAKANQRSEQQRSAPRSYPRPTTSSSGGRVSSMLSNVLNYYFLVSQWLTLVCGILSLVYPLLYYRALYIAIAMHLVALFQNNGRPQFNQYYAQRVFQDENLMIAFHCLIFLLGPPSLFFISPVLLRSVFMSAYMMNGLFSAKFPSFYRRFEVHFKKVLSNRQFFNQNIGLLEVLVGIYLVFSIIFMKNAIILTLLYWQIMGTKYQLNYNTRSAFQVVNRGIENALSKVPIPQVLGLYRKLVGFLYGMVDPQRVRQMQEQGGRPRCVIM